MTYAGEEGSLVTSTALVAGAGLGDDVVPSLRDVRDDVAAPGLDLHLPRARRENLASMSPEPVSAVNRLAVRPPASISPEPLTAFTSPLSPRIVMVPEPVSTLVLRPFGISTL
ncbi:hypothetical protein GCM10018952_53220 [Streptosporangium vulgare]